MTASFGLLHRQHVEIANNCQDVGYGRANNCI